MYIRGVIPSLVEESCSYVNSLIQWIFWIWSVLQFILTVSESLSGDSEKGENVIPYANKFPRPGSGWRYLLAFSTSGRLLGVV